MGFFTEFDHHKVGQDLDVASWDSYPLGFLEQFFFTDEEKHRYARQGHPDIAAFHHDLYRGCANGRWSVMEQQPGPVNWARYNPAPLSGMVRLWTLEAMAHGAELVSYFRWRQAPFAQEQMHAGLLRPDNVEDAGAREARQVAEEIAALGSPDSGRSEVALLFSYEAAWLLEAQPQGQSFRYLELVFAMYSALRQLGLNVDIVAADADLDGYAMVVVPTLPIMPQSLIARLGALTVPLLVGPRSGSKTENFSIPAKLAPGSLQELLPLKVTRVESLRPGITAKAGSGEISRWLEHVETDLPADTRLENGQAIELSSGSLRYLAAWPDAALLEELFGRMAKEAGLTTFKVAAGFADPAIGRSVFRFQLRYPGVGTARDG